MVVIRLSDENFSSLSLTNGNRTFTITWKDNLIKNCFTAFAELYFITRDRPKEIEITEDRALGDVLSLEESSQHLCGAILPLSLLKELCKAGFSPDGFQNFLQVAACLYKFELSIAQTRRNHNSSSSSSSMTSETSHSSHRSVELPLHSLWSVLLLSEVFGTTRVTLSCKKKLAEMVIRSFDSQVSYIGITLQREESVVIERKLIMHLLRYGPALTKSEEKSSTEVLEHIQHHHQYQHHHSFSSISGVSSKPADHEEEDLHSLSTISEIESVKPTKPTQSDQPPPSQPPLPQQLPQPHPSLVPVKQAPLVVPPPSNHLPQPETGSPVPAPAPVPTAVPPPPLLPPSQQRSSTPPPPPRQRSATPPAPARASTTPTAGAPRRTSPHPNPPSARSPSPSKLSSEDLLLSRNIALLRIKEAKIKKDLEDSKLLAMKALQESRMQSLKMTTALLREQQQQRQQQPPYQSQQKSRKVAFLSATTKPAMGEPPVRTTTPRVTTTPPFQLEKPRNQTTPTAERRSIPRVSPLTATTTTATTTPITPRTTSRTTNTPTPIRPNHNHNHNHSYSYRHSQSTIHFEDSTSTTTPGMVYSQEALRAVGLGFFPSLIQSSHLSSSSPLSPIPVQKSASSPLSQSLTETHRPFAAAAAAAAMSEPLLQLEVLIVRVWDLVECLGGTNPYVLLQLPFTPVETPSRRYQTAVKENSTSPFFGASFTMFCTASTIRDTAILKFLVWNRNYSLADELLGLAEVSLDSLASDQHASDSQIVALASTAGEPAGFLEVQLKLSEKETR